MSEPDEIRDALVAARDRFNRIKRAIYADDMARLARDGAVEATTALSKANPAVGLSNWIASIHWRNREANAHLIAAAPDMFEALRESVKQIDTIIEDGTHTDFRAWRDDLIAALSKANPGAS